ncbi:N-acyl homoserine lactonase [Microbacterium azadirachtae]|uniref:N-acyl homoserine lactonase n=1 Tax=Microbacterium azadirachtae TaxID=582680 RepID=A0A0F0KKR2_9MICO|nr:MBL fold metallo-hydrolase [Microbacterium azadirachtae]KJL19846.1 N-acyl homoserine lactonase [Microbacterium azadirachtae]
MRIGDIDIEPLFDGTGQEDASEIISRFGIPDAWRCHPESFGSDGHWEFPVGGFLVRTGDRVVLVDAGVGPVDADGYRGGDLLVQLRSHGVAPADVTDVLFTHLHFDHIGWATVEDRVTFVNATYRAHAADWEHFVTGAHAVGAAAQKLTPLRKQLELFDGDHVVAPGIDARWAAGHTPGTTVFVLSSDSERAVLLGDVVHSPVQFGEPDWTVVWDVDPQAASAVRNRLADDAAVTGDLLVAAHLPGMRFGRIVVTDGARRFVAI